MALSSIGTFFLSTSKYLDEAFSAAFEMEMSIRCDIEIVKGLIAELSYDDRMLVMTYFGKAKMNMLETSKIIGIPSSSCDKKIKRLTEKIRSDFFEINNDRTTDYFKAC